MTEPTTGTHAAQAPVVVDPQVDQVRRLQARITTLAARQGELFALGGHGRPLPVGLEAERREVQAVLDRCRADLRAHRAHADAHPQPDPAGRA